jgi:polyketide cyclase/dehydrase/lipid transport protein
MLKIIAVIAVILAIVIAIVLILALTKPDSFRVQRATTIRAPAENIFPLINDFHQWRVWSPYEHKDPAMKRTYGGADSGKGAVYAWDGDKNVGSGRMEILDSSAPSKIVIKLDFFKPFEGHNTAEFTMLPQGDATHVTWLMHGPAPFMSRVMQVFINFDNMIGKDFEVGLANLKKSAEITHHRNDSTPRRKRCRSIPICSTTAIAKRR